MKWPWTLHPPRRPGSGDDRSPRPGECATHDLYLHLAHAPDPRWPPMIAVCPAGHSSLAQDYCDVCGRPIDAAMAPPAPTSASTASAASTATPQPGRQACPNCGADNSVDALFCENCGYDFTTGTMPRSLVASAPTSTPSDNQSPAAQPLAPAVGNGSQAPEAFDWVAEVWIDPAWYEAQQSPDPMPSPGLPGVVPLRSK